MLSIELPKNRFTIVAMMMPMSSEPGTFFMTSTDVIMMPITPSSAVPWVMLPMVTNVEVFSTMMPAFFSPINAM